MNPASERDSQHIMYDNRSAWSLTALAPQRGSDNRLSDIQIAAMSELPAARQRLMEKHFA